MSEHGQAILAAALALSDAERAWLADQLEESLKGEDAEADADLLAELKRRAEEAKRDPTVLMPWSEVKRMT
jgi:putative addiction module component (TIGR02574 family)